MNAPPKILLLSTLLLTSCAAGPPQPRERLGCLPCPGPFTLYDVADPADLGVHRYEAWWDRLGEPDETSRGILYTCRAGFLDLAHMRESMDWVKYLYDRIHEHLADPHAYPDGSSFSFDWSDTRFELTLTRPAWWWDLTEEDRENLTRETSLREAQRLAVLIGAWHEAGTWYGQETIPPVSEQGSAFTYEDCSSHVFATIVAERALRAIFADPKLTWNLAVTHELPNVLKEFGVVDTDCEDQAVKAVEGSWWKDGAVIRRDLDTGLDTGVKTPWLVRGLPCCGGAAADAGRNNIGLPVPTLINILGRDMRPAFKLRILPPHWLLKNMLGYIPRQKAVTNDSEFFMIIERVRSEMLKTFGPGCDHP